MFAAISGLPGRRRDFLIQCQAKALRCQQDRVGLHHVKTSPPIGPESAQRNPQQPVATVEAQATRRVVLKNRKLVTKRQDLRLQSGTGSKSGDYQSEKTATKRELIVVTAMLSRMIGTSVFSDGTEFSVTTGTP